MTDINHKRRNRRPVNQRYRPDEYNNGLATGADKDVPAARTGRTDYLDKSSQGWSTEAPISGTRHGASIANDFVNGHRGMAKAVSGAKKYVRTRVRFHENAATRRLANEASEGEDGES